MTIGLFIDNKMFHGFHRFVMLENNGFTGHILVICFYGFVKY